MMPFQIEFEVPDQDLIRIKEFAGETILIESNLEFKVKSYYKSDLKFLATSPKFFDIKKVWSAERKLKRFNPRVKHVK